MMLRTGAVGAWPREGAELFSLYPAHGSHPVVPQVSGAVVVSGLIQLALGVSGLCGWAVRHCGPMVLAPSLSIIGLSAYKEAAFFCSTSWGAALLYVTPGPRCGAARRAPCHHGDRVGCTHSAQDTFGTLSLRCCIVTCAVSPRLVCLAVIFSQHLGSCRLPFCAVPQAPGCSTEPSGPTLRTFSVPWLACPCSLLHSGFSPGFWLFSVRFPGIGASA